MATILNQKKEKFNQENPDDEPAYVFDGTIEEYREMRKEGKVVLGKNVFLIKKQ